ncbi:hypothetical protein OIU34_18520 [Pararhizobium sp. BT-229]|uniref:hypothetical protein n=1 Tax=Pararhizobium sp. BT-229 TaxID=2986923 RepID=UPI0021F6E183|nr:hypothetical protein [Pararhizobium sp. BT-229]MCV9963874.1 hypothetical protein [Pararhizobium sp. BT-229]
MKIEANGSGKFRVLGDDGNVLVDDVSNADAWKFVDRHSDEPSSHAERESQWFWKKIAVEKHFEAGFFENRPGIPRRDQHGHLVVPERVSHSHEAASPKKGKAPSKAKRNQERPRVDPQRWPIKIISKQTMTMTGCFGFDAWQLHKFALMELDTDKIGILVYDSEVSAVELGAMRRVGGYGVAKRIVEHALKKSVADGRFDAGLITIDPAAPVYAPAYDWL